MRRTLDRLLAKMPHYGPADGAVRLVFEQWPRNVDADQVLAKVSVLNALYATRIMNVYPVVDHIVTLSIDDRLQAGDLGLVNDIGWQRIGRRERFLLSFASKYCAWHQPDHFQIFDSFVEWMLWLYRKQYQFAEFNRSALRDYPTFIQVIKQFKSNFGLKEFSRKQIDKFLWFEGNRVWARRQGSVSLQAPA